MRKVSRRAFISSSGVALGTLPFVRSIDSLAQVTNPVFRHGVASGDPLANRVILWTRVTPPAGATMASVSWMLARDPRFARVVARGELETGGARDFTVKVDATGLDPGTTYYYRFNALKGQSPVGRTRTLPSAGVSRVRLGMVSCANLPRGYFNAYACLARRADVDAVLHLGDYFYEYANAQYGDGTALGRIPSPDKELVALADYRGRHAQYKADPDCQEIHRQHPFICVWDDHEFANDAFAEGAGNHNPEDGDWWARRAAAAQAYYEWMPIREDAQTLSPRIYRTFTFGDLITLYMLDTRIIGRDRQAAGRDDIAVMESAGRSILGLAQEHWLAGEMAASVRRGAVWNVLGQQVMFAPQAATGQPGVSRDSWEGYRASRERVFDMVTSQRVGNFTVLTGDVHSTWAYDLPRRPFDGYDKGTGKGSIGVEIAGTSVTSPSNLGVTPEGKDQQSTLLKTRPHLYYADGSYRGYVVVDLTRQRLQADVYGMATIEARRSDERFVKSFITESGKNHLVESSTPVPAPTAADPAP
jgi:alkaline phosphatase D